MKGQWEHRVAMLLTGTGIQWYFKAPDGAGYGGKPRIDFLACDVWGRFIAIEVKSLPANRVTFTLNKEVPAVQQAVLRQVSESANGVAILAVGVGDDNLILYNWGKICHQEKVNLFGHAETRHDFLQLPWWGPKEWRKHNLHQILMKHWTYQPRMYAGLEFPEVKLPVQTWTEPKKILVAKSMEEVLAPPSQGQVRGITLTPQNSPALARAEAKLRAAIDKSLANALESIETSQWPTGTLSATTTPNENSEPPSSPAEPSPSTLRRPASASMKRKALILEQRSSRRGTRRSF